MPRYHEGKQNEAFAKEELTKQGKGLWVTTDSGWLAVNTDRNGQGKRKFLNP